jgi:hypothetical protein
MIPLAEVNHIIQSLCSMSNFNQLKSSDNIMYNYNEDLIEIG